VDTTRTRKRTGRTRRRGNGSSVAGRSSSRERPRDRRRHRGALRASARVAAAKRLTAEGISDRRSVRSSRSPRGVGLGGLRALASQSQSAIRQARERRRRQGCQRLLARTGIRTNKPGNSNRREAQWGTRRETRPSPVSLASSGPEPLGARSLRYGRLHGRYRVGRTARGATSRG
jgi:hypothetical protein